MLTVQAFETNTCYMFEVTDGTEENTFTYEFCKQPPAGVELANYLQSCKQEAILLAELAIAQSQPPTPIDV